MSGVPKILLDTYAVNEDAGVLRSLYFFPERKKADGQRASLRVQRSE